MPARRADLDLGRRRSTRPDASGCFSASAKVFDAMSSTCGTVLKHISEPAAQRDLLALMARRWPNAFGRSLEISMCAIDAAGRGDDVVRVHVIAARVRRRSWRCAAYLATRSRGSPACNASGARKPGHRLQVRRRAVFQPWHLQPQESPCIAIFAKNDPSRKGFHLLPERSAACDFSRNWFPSAECRSSGSASSATVGRRSAIASRTKCTIAMIYATAAGLRCGVNFITAEGWADRRAKLKGPPPTPPQGLRRGEVRIVEGPLSLAERLPH